MSQATILVVDDELGPRESLRMILKPSYEVLTAESGARALELLRERRVDVVTLDLKMPGLSGTEVLEAVKGLDPRIEVIIITGYGSLKSATEAIRYGVADYIAKPFNVAEILSVVDRAVARRDQALKVDALLKGLEADGGTGDGERRAGSAFAALRQRLRGLVQREPGQRAAAPIDSLEFVKVLAAALESKDAYTHGHSQRVAHYAAILGQDLGLSDRELRDLQIGSFLHDIGKVGVCEQYIKKQGRLTPEEWAVVRAHPEKGAELIAPLRLGPAVVSAVRHHHERIDGRGFPDRLGGSDLSVTARIVCIADAYDAMTSDRPYRRALSRDAARQELKRCAGTQFDLDFVERFLRVLDKHPWLDQNSEAPVKNGRVVSGAWAGGILAGGHA
ncbi:MAG TPA: HD domain-containing phosphohydrolase [Thermodesulfobacteriota bacterium]